MTAAGVSEGRRVAYGLVLGQATLTAAIAATCQLAGESHAALSAAVGGGIGTAASLVLALFAFRSKDQDGKRIARAFLVGEAAKFGVVVVLFALAFGTMKEVLVPGALLGTYIATFAVYWLALGKVMSVSGR